MTEFYSVVFTNKIGKESEQIVIGNPSQVNDWAIGYAASYGCAYTVQRVARYDMTGTIKNLCNN